MDALATPRRTTSLGIDHLEHADFCTRWRDTEVAGDLCAAKAPVALAARRMPHHAGQARRHRVLAWFRLPRQGRESVGHPVGDEGAEWGDGRG